MEKWSDLWAESLLAFELNRKRRSVALLDPVPLASPTDTGYCLFPHDSSRQTNITTCYALHRSVGSRS